MSFQERQELRGTPQHTLQNDVMWQEEEIWKTYSHVSMNLSSREHYELHWNQSQRTQIKIYNHKITIIGWIHLHVFNKTGPNSSVRFNTVLPQVSCTSCTKPFDLRLTFVLIRNCHFAEVAAYVTVVLHYLWFMVQTADLLWQEYTAVECLQKNPEAVAQTALRLCFRNEQEQPNQFCMCIRCCSRWVEWVRRTDGGFFSFLPCMCSVLENMSGQGSTVGGKFPELKSIIDKVRDQTRVGVCLDTCHAFAAGEWNLRLISLVPQSQRKSVKVPINNLRSAQLPLQSTFMGMLWVYKLKIR